MYPREGEVLHYSENPEITGFDPHVAATAQQADAFVWAVDAKRSPDYWFPRDCPRAMAWVTEETSDADRLRIIGPGCGERVHAIEFRWLARMMETKLYAYRFDAKDFEAFGEPVPHAHVSRVPVTPIAPPEPVGNLVDLHAAAGIQLRCLPTIMPFWEDVVTRTLGFSGIRLRNAQPG